MSQTESEPAKDGGQRQSRGRGRPRKRRSERRTERVTVRLSIKELAQVNFKANCAGRALSTYLREAGLGKKLASVEERLDRDETIRQLAHAGDGLNRIAETLEMDAPGRATSGEYHKPSLERHLREVTAALEKALQRV